MRWQKQEVRKGHESRNTDGLQEQKRGKEKSLSHTHQASRRNVFLVSEIPALGNPGNYKSYILFLQTIHCYSLEWEAISGLVHGSHEGLINYCEPFDPPACPERGNSGKWHGISVSLRHQNHPGWGNLPSPTRPKDVRKYKWPINMSAYRQSATLIAREATLRIRLENVL